jgi:hypothetical protein
VTLPASPSAISMFGVNVELGLASGAQINLLGANVRGLFAIPTGPVNLLAGRGKSYMITYSGTLTGSSSLSIPALTTTVNLTGRGGMGGVSAGTPAVYGWDLASRTDTFSSHTSTPFGTSGGPPTTTSATAPTGLGYTTTSNWYTLYTAAVTEILAANAVYGWDTGNRTDTYLYESQVPTGVSRTTAPTTTGATAPTGTGYTTTSYWYYESKAAVAAVAGSGYHAAFAGSGYHPYVAAVPPSPAVYAWDEGSGGVQAPRVTWSSTTSTPIGGFGEPATCPAVAPTQPYYTTTAHFYTGGAPNYDQYSKTWWAYTVSAATSGSAAVEAYWDSPPYAAYWDTDPVAAIPAYYYQYSSVWPSYLVSAAVAYRAPAAAVYSQYSSSWPSYLVSAAVAGTPYAGASTTATLNGVTRTWVGGTGAVLGTESTQSLTSTGAGQAMTYSVAGSLSYSYQGV